MIYKYTSIKEILAKVYRELYTTDLQRPNSIIEFALEALEKLDVNVQFDKKQKKIPISNYRACIPDDLVTLLEIRYKGAILRRKQEIKFNNTIDGYQINAGYIITNKVSGELLLIYNGYVTDEDGLPMIPDNIYVKDAISNYVIMKLQYPKVFTGEIDPKLYDFVVMAWERSRKEALGAMKFPDIDQMDAIRSMWQKMIPYVKERYNSFENLSFEQELNHQTPTDINNQFDTNFNANVSSSYGNIV